jgi:hypothetical protein
VHHKRYIAGRLPWEYPFEDCETLCAGCHAAHHGKIPPKVGWEVAGYDDLGELSGACELCGTEIRHVFLVQHENWPSMEVGEVCCDHLTCSEIASNHMESVRRYGDRKKRFVGSPRWQQYRAGHEYISQDHIFVELRHLPSGFQLRMNGRKGKTSYPDSLEAKARAFDVLESQKHADFIKRIRRTVAPPDFFLRLK